MDPRIRIRTRIHPKMSWIRNTGFWASRIRIRIRTVSESYGSMDPDPHLDPYRTKCHGSAKLVAGNNLFACKGTQWTCTLACRRPVVLTTGRVCWTACMRGPMSTLPTRCNSAERNEYQCCTYVRFQRWKSQRGKIHASLYIFQIFPKLFISKHQ
jgi:hypothetical protein